MSSNEKFILFQHIINRLKALDIWHIELDEFQEKTPEKRVKFSNIIATLNPSAPKRFVIACHYDSKKFPFKFIAAIDSAVPCALMLALARELKCLLQHRTMVSLNFVLLLIPDYIILLSYYLRGSLNKFPDFFCVGTFIDITHMKL